MALSKSSHKRSKSEAEAMESSHILSDTPMPCIEVKLLSQVLAKAPHPKHNQTHTPMELAVQIDAQIKSSTSLNCKIHIVSKLNNIDSLILRDCLLCTDERDHPHAYVKMIYEAAVELLKNECTTKGRKHVIKHLFVRYLIIYLNNFIEIQSTTILSIFRYLYQLHTIPFSDALTFLPEFLPEYRDQILLILTVAHSNSDLSVIKVCNGQGVPANKATFLYCVISVLYSLLLELIEQGLTSTVYLVVVNLIRVYILAMSGDLVQAIESVPHGCTDALRRDFNSLLLGIHICFKRLYDFAVNTVGRNIGVITALHGASLQSLLPQFASKQVAKDIKLIPFKAFRFYPDSREGTLLKKVDISKYQF